MSEAYNLSILDFKEALLIITLAFETAYNLSILDFKVSLSKINGL